MTSILERLMQGLPFGRKPLTYEQEKELARHEDARVRQKLAARQDVRPEILYYLAEDSDSRVRRKIAANPATPLHADVILARDGDDEVRCQLAGKIARLVPGLSLEESDRLGRLAFQALEILARDQLTRVRVIIAETLKDVPNLPPVIVNRLARDAELAVAAPVLRFSPLLSDEDLLEIIENDSRQGTLIAIARRLNLREKVSDAIVSTNDREAVAALLANQSTQIREETLDTLIQRAPMIEEWHAPLSRRPHLSVHAAQKIASFVADSLLEEMENRADLDSTVIHKVKEEVHRRLEEDAQEDERATAAPSRLADEAAMAKELDKARRMHKEGALDERVLSESLEKGDVGFVAAALSLLLKQPLGLIRRVLESHSAKGVVALAKKARLSMDFAVNLQIKAAHITPDDALQPKAGKSKDEAFPIGDEEMDWQIGFFHSRERRAQTRRAVAPGLADPDWEKTRRLKNRPPDPDWVKDEAEAEEEEGDTTLAESDLEASARAREWYDEDKLTEEALQHAAQRGQRGFLMAALALLSGLSETSVRRIFESHSAKAVCALVWKTGRSMALANDIQTRLLRLPHSEVLFPDPSGGYPLSQETLEWEIEFFGD